MKMKKNLATDELLKLLNDGCQIDRRNFLKFAGKATLATLALGAPLPAFAKQSEISLSQTLLEPKADTLIVLWLAGGMPHTDTFDPKELRPYKKGMLSRDVLSTFPSIPTVVDDIRLSAGFEGIASIMDRAALLRSYVSADLGPVLHTRHQYHWHTGYIPPQSLVPPHIGSWVSKILGPRNPDMPAFINIGQRFSLGGADDLKSFMSAGILGAEHGPLNIPFPIEARESFTPVPGFTLSRFADRHKFYKKLLGESAVHEFGSTHHRESIVSAVDSAHRIVESPAAKAFDLSLETQEKRQAYGDSRFGQGCLLARRLVEAGARYIEVSSEYIPFGNWDTHKDGHRRTKVLKQEADPAIKQLVLDLEERGLLDRTLIVVASEFSRVAGRNPGKDNRSTDLNIDKPSLFGLHRHFVGGGSTLLIGAGVKRGSVYGRTSDAFPCECVENPVGISDLHATIYRIMGIPADYSFEIEKRPFYVTNNGEGKVVEALLA